MANQRGETTSIGHFYNRCVDAVNNLFDTMSFWTHSKDVEFVDGKTAETKVGAINGITSDISGEADDIAASIKCVNQLNSSLGGVAFGVDSNGNRGYYDASGKFVNFIDGDGGFIIGVADITNFKNTNRGFIINQNTAITLSKEYDLSKYKYLQLIYNDYNYYTRTWGIGYTKTPNDSYSNCMATSNKVTVSANGNSQNTYTTKTIYLDISGVNEKGYPFVYLTSSVYSHILKLQLVNELEEI